MHTAAHDKVRIHYEIAADFEGVSLGAVWDDIKAGMGHFSRGERVVLVSDIA